MDKISLCAAKIKSALKQKELFLLAICNNDEDKLNKLLSQKGTEIIISHTDETPLLVAVRLKKPELVDVILRYANTNVNAMNKFGRTSVYEACTPPCIEIITKLINHKANVNLSDVNKITPLMRASGYGNVPAMNLLIEAGANINAKDDFDRTAVIYALKKKNNLNGLNVLLINNAKLSLPKYPQYNPLLFAICKRPELVYILIPFCKCPQIFNEALCGALVNNQIDIFQTLLENGAKLTNVDTDCLLNSIITKGLADVFNLFWQNINKNFFLNPDSFIKLFTDIFHVIDEVLFFESSLKMIINTPDFNCNLTGQQNVITKMFEPVPGPNHDWNLCKDTLLEFCEYINRQGVRLCKNELSIIIKYFNKNCQFIAELLTVFFKYHPELSVSLEDVICFSSTDLNLTSLLLYNCTAFLMLHLSLSHSIYTHLDLHEFSENVLIFFLQRFTPSRTDVRYIRYIEKFDHISIERLQVPTLMEIARDSLRRTIKDYKLKEVFQNFYIPSAIEDIVCFKTAVNDI